MDFFGYDFTLGGVRLLSPVLFNVGIYEVANCFCVRYNWDF